MIIIWVYFIVVALCVIGWIAGEINKMQPLRILCVIALLPLVGFVLYNLGQTTGGFQASIAASGATDRFIDAAVQQIDAEQEASVHRELRALANRINETYEGITFVEEMDAATARLSSD